MLSPQRCRTELTSPGSHGLALGRDHDPLDEEGQVDGDGDARGRREIGGAVG